MVSNSHKLLIYKDYEGEKDRPFEHGIATPKRMETMLTDTKLRNLKPQEKLYKVNDRDGLYVAVTPAGAISFRYNYSINGRQETMTFGRYGVGGITLSEAREQLGAGDVYKIS